MLPQDPVHVINKYGADALRLYLINSPVVRAESLRFEEVGRHCLPFKFLSACSHLLHGVMPLTRSTLPRCSFCVHCAGGGVCHREGCVPALV